MLLLKTLCLIGLLVSIPAHSLRQNVSQLIDDISPASPDVYEIDSDPITFLDMENASSDLSPSLVIVGCGLMLSTVIYSYVSD